MTGDGQERPGSGSSTAADAARFRRAREIFEEVSASPGEDWQDRVRALAAGDEELERQAGLLLRAHRENPDFLEQPSQIGPFRILEKIGEGGMGIVYRAEQQEPRREVALKVLAVRSTELIHRFEFEQRVLALMDHPGVAKVYQTGTTRAGNPYLAMELVEGESIAEYCERHGLDTAERVRLFVAVCRGIEHAHRKGIIHRDVKPSNILVKEEDGRPTPRIIDFGIAKLIDQGEGEEGRTRAGQAIGTPAYMAPEQLAGGLVDTGVDIYAMGVVLFELLTGELPSVDGAASSEPPSAALRRRAAARGVEGAEARRRLRAVAGDLDRIVLKAMAGDPEQRFASAGELREDLARYLSDEPVRARGPGRIYRAKKFVKRNRWSVVAAVALLTVLGLFGYSRLELVGKENELRAELDRFGALMDTVVGLVRRASPGEARGTTIEARALLDEASVSVLQQLAGHPAEEVRFRVRIGDTYRELGYFEEARTHLLRASELVDETHPGDTHERLVVLNAMGNVYSAANDHTLAIPWYELARPVAAATDPSGEDEAAVLKNLADCYARTGQPDEALELLEEAAAIRRAAGNRTGVVVTLTSIADLERRQGRIDAAIEALTDALELRRELMDANDPKLAFGYYARAQAYLDAERFDEARDDLETALAIWRETLRENHPNLAACLEKLARACWGQGELAEADRRFLEAIAIEEALAGDDPRELAKILGSYAEFLADSGRQEDAARVEARRRSLVEAKG